MNYTEIIKLRQSLKQQRIEKLINFKKGDMLPKYFIGDYLYREEMNEIILYKSPNSFNHIIKLIAVNTYLYGTSFNEIKAVFEKLTGYDDPRNENPEFEWIEFVEPGDVMEELYKETKMPIPISLEEYEYFLSFICFELGLHREITVLESLGTDIYERKFPIYQIIGDQLLINTFWEERRQESEYE